MQMKIIGQKCCLRRLGKIPHISSARSVITKCQAIF